MDEAKKPERDIKDIVFEIFTDPLVLALITRNPEIAAALKVVQGVNAIRNHLVKKAEQKEEK